MINTTLRSDADRGAAHAGDDEEMVVERRRGFRMGFGIVLLFVAALIGLYAAAGWLAQTVPALAPLLAAYLEMATVSAPESTGCWQPARRAVRVSVSQTGRGGGEVVALLGRT